jgi:sec-independent protein translocase protein TatA
MPEIGIAGLVVILIVALFVFGPRRLPEIGRSLGKGMREFKDSITGRDEKSELPAPHMGETVRRRAGRRRVPLRARSVAARPGLSRSTNRLWTVSARVPRTWSKTRST